MLLPYFKVFSLIKQAIPFFRPPEPQNNSSPLPTGSASRDAVSRTSPPPSEPSPRTPPLPPPEAAVHRLLLLAPPEVEPAVKDGTSIRPRLQPHLRLHLLQHVQERQQLRAAGSTRTMIPEGSRGPCSVFTAGSLDINAMRVLTAPLKGKFYLPHFFLFCISFFH
jgi:hypothetical protein